MRFHCIGIPHTITNKEYVACAFTQKVLKFCEMMYARGHTVFHYGHEDSDLQCTEHVTVLTRDTFNEVYGNHDHRTKLFTYDISDAVYTQFSQRTVEEIRKRREHGDFVLAFWGVGHKPICDQLDGITIVEPGIGYPATFAPYKVFESYTLYHIHLGMSKVTNCFVNDCEFENDAIIPNYYDPSEFEFCPEEKSDYFLFVGRVGTSKGLGRAIRLSQALGVRLIVAGQNGENGFREEGFWPIPEHVTFIGYIDTQQRKHLMARARAVICFSKFIEPFCGVHAEAMLSGTPVITSDWGAFSEYVIPGKTGFRCRTFQEMVEAGRAIDTISPLACREWAMSKFSADVVSKQYEEYFKRINPQRSEEEPFAERLVDFIVSEVKPNTFSGFANDVYIEKITAKGLRHVNENPDVFISIEKAQFDESIFDTAVESNPNMIIWSAGHEDDNCKPSFHWMFLFFKHNYVRNLAFEQKMFQEMSNGYHMGWFLRNAIVLVRRDHLKIAIWCEQQWAHGRISQALKRYIPNSTVNFYNWGYMEETEKLFGKNGTWDNYDYIITPTGVFNIQYNFPKRLREKLIVTMHCPSFDNDYFREEVVHWPEVKYTGVSRDIVSMLQARDIQATWTPYGADLHIFKNDHVVLNPIRRIGITGGYHSRATPAYINTKGLPMFDEICRRVGAEPVYLLEKVDNEIYKDIDLLVCASEIEAGPLGIFEAAACGVPVLTRPVGNAKDIQGISVFHTVDEAVTQIQYWNEHIDELKQYAEKITQEVRTHWSMEKLIQDNVLPLLKRQLPCQ